MGDIINITNLNHYTGKYHPGKVSVEDKICWYLYQMLTEIFPVLALRNRRESPNWPLWNRGRNTEIGIDVTIAILREWKAFRSPNPVNIAPAVAKNTPSILIDFQAVVSAVGAECALDIAKLKGQKYRQALVAMGTAVGAISALKGSGVPMLGSKVMHFLLPEFFPVWDTAWVKKNALDYEDLDDATLGHWLPKGVDEEFPAAHRAESMVYMRYLALMFKELDDTPEDDYQKVYDAFVKHTEIPTEVIDWHMHDLSPLIFEICLLGKHNWS